MAKPLEYQKTQVYVTNSVLFELKELGLDTIDSYIAYLKHDKEIVVNDLLIKKTAQYNAVLAELRPLQDRIDILEGYTKSLEANNKALSEKVARLSSPEMFK